MKKLHMLVFSVALWSAWLTLPAPIQSHCQEETPSKGTGERFLILQTTRAETLQKELSSAAAKGYRVVAGDAGYKLLALEKDPTGEKHQYWFTDSIIKALKDRKTEGYRVLPSSFGSGVHGPGAVLEKLRDGEPALDYHLIAAPLSDGFQNHLNDWSAKGFHLLTLAPGGLMERSAGAPAQGSADRYVVLSTYLTGNMERDLTRTVARGYRVVAAAGVTYKMVVVLEKLAPGEPIPAYRLISTNRTGTLESEISAASQQEYHMLPQTLSALEKGHSWMLGPFGHEVAVIMEKRPRTAPMDYKVLGTTQVATLNKELAECETAGWSMNQLIVSHSERVIVLEKPRQ